MTTEPRVEILCGDCREIMAGMEAESVHTVCTSPPYWGLRAYRTEPQRWGGDPECAHECLTERYYREGGNSGSSALAFSGPGPENAQRLKETRWRENTTCKKCGAWFGELGLEPTPQLYVQHLVSVFREVWRVLRRDGTCWLNLGDCYATGAGNVGDWPGGGAQGERWAGYRGTRSESPKHAAGAIGPMTQPNRLPLPGLKPKDLVGIPWRVAFALQEDGWWLRSDVIWSKPNPMPESVRDRPTKAHEYVFLLTKAERYYYDADAIREPSLPERTAGRNSSCVNDKIPVTHKKHMKAGPLEGNHGTMGHDGNGMRYDRVYNNPLGRNRRSVWVIATHPYPEAHFATFPPALVEPCILAGSRPGDTVLDPFAGSGTVGEVAAKHGRSAILIELSLEYCDLIRKRLDGVQATLPMEGTG